jgi:hypothetical protein
MWPFLSVSLLTFDIGTAIISPSNKKQSQRKPERAMTELETRLVKALEESTHLLLLACIELKQSGKAARAEQMDEQYHRNRELLKEAK